MFPFFLLPLPFFFHVVGALLNVTIDDNDSTIVYKGDWESSSSIRSTLDYGGGHAVSTDRTASATVTFAGVAIYYLSPRWPFAINTQLTLDGGQGIIVNLTDPNATPAPESSSESSPYSVIWSATGLSNTTHSLVLTMASTGSFIVADGFIFTVDNGSSISTSASQTSSSTSSATLSASSAGTSITPVKHDTLAIAVGSAVGALAIVAAAILAFFFYRRRHQAPQRVSNVLDEWGADAYPPVPVPFVAAAAASGHVPSMSDASTGPLLTTPWERPVTEYRDNPRATIPSTAGSFSEYGGSSSAYGGGASSAYGGGSSSAYGGASTSMHLPPGAMAAEFGSYADDNMGDLATASSSIARAASSSRLLAVSSAGRNEKSRPMREETYTPAPPAYSES